MIEIECVYKNKEGKYEYVYKYFYSVSKAVGFLYAIKNSNTLHFTGGLKCDDLWELEEIQRRFH